MLRKINDITDTIKKITQGFIPQTAIILGSGLGGYGDRINPVNVLEYSKIENFPRTSVKGHSGKMIFGMHKGHNIVILSGRLHYYEGYNMADVVLPVRVLKMLGVKNIIITNAAGGISENLNKGDIMLIKDHISLFCPNPLIGDNIDQLGERFPDMTHPYDTKLINAAKQAAVRANMLLKEGVYCYVTGPSYETAADIKTLNILGADAVGMSTVPEVIAARHCGIKVCGFSFIANKAAGITDESLNHSDIVNAFKVSEEKFYNMLDILVASIL